MEWRGTVILALGAVCRLLASDLHLRLCDHSCCGEIAHLALDPEIFNDFGYFYARLYWTGLGLRADIVKKYVLMSAVMHVAVTLKRPGRSR